MIEYVRRGDRKGRPYGFYGSFISKGYLILPSHPRAPFQGAAELARLGVVAKLILYR